MTKNVGDKEGNFDRAGDGAVIDNGRWAKRYQRNRNESEHASVGR